MHVSVPEYPRRSLKELEDEVFDMQKEQIEDIQMRDTLNQAQRFERLSQSRRSRY